MTIYGRIHGMVKLLQISIKLQARGSVYQRKQNCSCVCTFSGLMLAIDVVVPCDMIGLVNGCVNPLFSIVNVD
jgi:hypothetical protein